MKKSLLKVINQEKSDRTPIWFMRQAGRYLPEFRQIRQSYSFLDLCTTPEAAAEVTMQPIVRFDLDAAILFSDILIVPMLMGSKVNFTESGPEVDSSNLEDYDAAKTVELITNAIKVIRQKLVESYPKVALIGFAGAPWTVACYMVEGKLSKDFNKVKGMAYSDEKALDKLIKDITKVTIYYLKAQVDAGAEVIKIFDSWAGVLTPEQFERWVIEPTKEIVSALKESFPTLKIIGFPRGAGLMYKEYTLNTGVDVVALDQFVPLKWAIKSLDNVVLQGNLDNILLAYSKEKAVAATKEIVQIMGPKRFIFNLGHGIIPRTPTENLSAVIQAVRELD